LESKNKVSSYFASLTLNALLIVKDEDGVTDEREQV